MNRIPSWLRFCATFFILSLSSGGCAQKPADQSYTKANLVRISTELRSGKTFDLDALEVSDPHWLDSANNRATFFQDLAPGNRTPSFPANWKDVNLVQDALLAHSLLAAKSGDEPTARKSLSLTVSLAVSTLKAPFESGLLDADGQKLSDESVSTTTVFMSQFPLTEMKQYLDRYPDDAKKWKWYQTTCDSIISAHSNTRSAAKQLLHLPASGEPQRATLLNNYRTQMVSEFGKISAVINSK